MRDSASYRKLKDNVNAKPEESIFGFFAFMNCLKIFGRGVRVMKTRTITFLTLGGIIFLLVTMALAPPADADLNYGNMHWLPGERFDANKTGPSNDSMCWAASASNALAWGKWNEVDSSRGSFPTEQSVFDYHVGKWPNDGNSMSNSWAWWINGQGGGPAGGNFWPEYNWNDYYRGWNPTDYSLLTFAMKKIQANIEQGYATSITISKVQAGGEASSHALSVWGIQYETDEYGGEIYQGLWYTDSNNNMNTYANVRNINSITSEGELGPLTWVLEGQSNDLVPHPYAGYIVMGVDGLKGSGVPEIPAGLMIPLLGALGVGLIFIRKNFCKQKQ